MKQDDFELLSFEEIAELEPPDGVFTDPNAKDTARIRVRDLFQYCKKKGIKPSDLTEEERKQFFIEEE